MHQVNQIKDGCGFSYPRLTLVWLQISDSHLQVLSDSDGLCWRLFPWFEKQQTYLSFLLAIAKEDVKS